MPQPPTPPIKNPKRVVAGRINGYKRRPWTEAERQRLRDQCAIRKPWQCATGPRTPTGKALASANGFKRLSYVASARSAEERVRMMLADVPGIMANLEQLRSTLMGGR